ncbi:MAG: hypothetical protein QOD63_2210 [Actinomycetota bacterium]|jgi:hypothetical protein|nr:hypothetical protein [Actinomycetota bacterium]
MREDGGIKETVVFMDGSCAEQECVIPAFMPELLVPLSVPLSSYMDPDRAAEPFPIQRYRPVLVGGLPSRDDEGRLRYSVQ